MSELKLPLLYHKHGEFSTPKLTSNTFSAKKCLSIMISMYDSS